MTDPTKLHVAVDLDDVVLDFFQGVIDSMLKEFGVLLMKEDVTTWDDNPVKLFDWKAWGYKSWWDWLRAHDWLWSTFPAIDGAVGGIHALRSQGHYVECLTSKPDWAEAQVWNFMRRWQPEFNRVTIVGLDERKCEMSQADILVDDRPAAIEDWVASADDRLGILYRQPWNDSFQLGERMARVHDWHGVLELVTMMEDA